MNSFYRHPDKGFWEPTQRLEHLGLDVDTEAGLFRVPPEKLKRLMQQAKAIRAMAAREARLVPVRLLAGCDTAGESTQQAPHHCQTVVTWCVG